MTAPLFIIYRNGLEVKNEKWYNLYCHKLFKIGYLLPHGCAAFLF